jgi:RNA polymerase sigma-70 factor (ECF subfamily)
VTKLGFGKILSAFVQAQPRLKAMAVRRTGNWSTAEDLLQDSWLKLENRNSVDVIDNPGGFITKVVSHTISDHARKERRRAEIDAEVNDLLWDTHDEISPERAIIGQQSLAKVTAALNQLPEKTRRIFMLNRIDQVPHRRIAEMYGITDEAVYYHIRRALEHLSELRDQINR